MSPEIHILLVDDHKLFRRGLTALLAETQDLRVVGEAGDTGEALRLTSKLQPDIILLDNHLPGNRGVDAVQSLRKAAPCARVLMLTVGDDTADLGTALRAGASGYLLKVCEANDLIDAVRRAHRGEVVIGAEMAPKLMQTFTAPDTLFSPAAEINSALALPHNISSENILSPRERLIAVAIARGESNKKIARDFDIAETTVKAHVQNILRKLNMASRVQIAVYASVNSLID
uniref:Putative Nitrate/nitrite response regulator protein narL n=1 Tax=mine drainage metagenome TaxID=410659 RepID=E6QPL3_9ZZZZ